MKITSVNSHIGHGPRYPWVFLTIDTDEGLTGLGQAQGGVVAHMIHKAIPHLEDFLLGEDSSRIDYIWTRLFSEFDSTGNRGFGSALISAVDIALWDIKGKRLGLPIYELLGGKFRDNLRLYSNGWMPREQTPEAYARAAFETIAEGHTALKMDPFFHFDDVSPLQHGHNISPTGLRKGVEITRAVRNAIGPDIELLIDLHGRYDVAAAVRVGKALGEFDIGWLEEPVPPENHDALRPSSKGKSPCPSASANDSSPVTTSDPSSTSSSPTTSCPTSSAAAASPKCAKSPPWPRHTTSPSPPTTPPDPSPWPPAPKS